WQCPIQRHGERQLPPGERLAAARKHDWVRYKRTSVGQVSNRDSGGAIPESAGSQHAMASGLMAEPHRPPRLLMLSHYFEQRRGGIEIVAAALARGLTAQGFGIVWL